MMQKNQIAHSYNSLVDSNGAEVRSSVSHDRGKLKM